MVGTHLQIPGIAHDRELEQAVEEVTGQHLPGGIRAGMAGQLASDAVMRELIDLAGHDHRRRVQPAAAVLAKRLANARAARLGDVDEQEAFLDGKKHRRGWPDRSTRVTFPTTAQSGLCRPLFLAQRSARIEPTRADGETSGETKRRHARHRPFWSQRLLESAARHGSR